MRVLHVGVGFSPWLVNGLLLHTEAVMEGQARAGREVAYFFAGRHLPRLRRPLLHRWRRGGVAMFEWMNSPIVVGRDRGTADPDRDLDDPPTEAAFARVLSQFRPDVVHVHDLGGLPSAILTVAEHRGLPVVMTLHDYQALCPTIRLYDADGQNCLRARPGEMCVRCCADAPIDNLGELHRTVLYTRARVRARVPHLDEALRRPAVDRAGSIGIRLAERVSGLQTPGSPALNPHDAARPSRPRPGARAYDRRRERNVGRLNRLDALIAPSDGAREVWARLGVRAELIRTLPISPAHLARLDPKRRSRPHDPMRFAVLNGASSTEKGADLIVDALAELSRRGLEPRFRVAVHGPIAGHAYHALTDHPSVDFRGEYRPEELSAILEEVDVGLMPSVWREVYGFAGLEFVAKGIPVIGNALGGIPEYVRAGQTGWLNRSCSARELAELMANVIDHPGEVEDLGNTAVRLRSELVRPFQAQLADLDQVYAEIVASRRKETPEGAV
jgi:glycosyltransferase involved in cell wall biosynthesis